MFTAKRFLRWFQLTWLWVCAWFAGRPNVRVVIAITQEDDEGPWILLKQIQQPHGATLLVPPMTDLNRMETMKDCIDRLMKHLGVEVHEMVPCAAFNPVSKYRPHKVYLTWHAELEGPRPKQKNRKKDNVWSWYSISALDKPHKPLLQAIVRRAGYGEYLERDPNKTPVNVKT